MNKRLEDPQTGYNKKSKYSVEKALLLCLLLSQSPSVHANTEFNTNTELVETLAKRSQEMPGDIMSFEDVAKHQRIKESIHKFMDTEKMKEVLKKHNYNQKDAENIIYKMLTSDSGRQLLTELSHDKDIQETINNPDINDIEEKIEEKITEKKAIEYTGMALLVLGGLSILGFSNLLMKIESIERDPYN